MSSLWVPLNAGHSFVLNTARSSLAKELRLLPGREVTALIDLVEVDDLGISPGKTVTGPDARVWEKAIAELPNRGSAILGPAGRQ